VSASILLLLSLAAVDVNASVVRMSVIEEGSLWAGAQAPPISRARQLKDGKEVKVELGNGIPTFINFWATTCAPCVRELPELAKASARYQGRVRFIGLVAGDSNHRDAIAMADKFAIPYENYEVDDFTERAWLLSSFPTSVLVDGKGMVQWSVGHAVDAKDVDEQLQRILDPTVKGLLAGEIVVGAGIAIRNDGRFLITRDLLQLGERLVAVTSDGKTLKLDGVIAEDEERGLAIVKVNAALPAATFAPSVQAGSEIFVDGKQGTIADVRSNAIVHNVTTEARHGTPIVDAEGKVVAVVSPLGAIHADAIRAFLSTTNIDGAPQSLGPNVKRNWIISGVFFGVIILFAFVVPALVRAVKRRRRPRAPVSTLH
jgi:thiol-disulfide isomerase/thioredoxin